ncbi:Dihydroorotate dehydrogenase [bioreactor metagenome]|uniref:Dihydroorotate dehydrogenase n=1 Tax=bioreactor metagenome TaxID=1076179 RepID=A0A644YA32_9ZZZZ
MSFASEIEKAGADALELNVFILPSDPAMKDHEIKATYHSIVDGVRAHTKLPIALKSHWYFTDMASFYTEMSHKVDSLVLFNRFFSPDIDIKNRKVISSGSISSPSDHAQVLRWIGILAGKVASSLSASGGIHNAEAVIKSLLAGADVVQIASALYIRRDGVIPSMLEGLSNWMKEQGISSIDEFRGSLSHQNIANPLLYERAQFMKYFSDFRSK